MALSSGARSFEGTGRNGVHMPFDAALDPLEAARAAGLIYVTDADPGIARRRFGKHFAYRFPGGTPMRDEAVLARIRKLAIPPAYTGVWICTNPRGHLQATGRDQRGRKQYRYHPRWREVRDETKYGRLAAFGRALPLIRERVDADLAQRGLPRARVLATIVRLLEATLIRVGNDEYAKANKSFGLTTLRKRHVDIDGSELQFEFRAKSGRQLRLGLRDRRLARIVRSCQDLPGHRLFQYFDEDGTRQPIDSADVNDYLREIAGQDFTAKDFRTWAGSVLAAQALAGEPPAESETAAKHVLARCIEDVAEQLGNTPAVCRKCYVHPGIVAAYLDGSLASGLGLPEAADAAGAQPDGETALLGFLERLGLEA